MYRPAQFDQQNIELMHNLIRSRPLATLVTIDSDGINANHIPLHLSALPAPYGTLQGHVARSNSLWQDFAADTEVLAIFHGPESYISPSWYATKKETGKVVPTWNYVVVHAYGTLRIIDDAAWIRQQLQALTNEQETDFADPWTLDDAPADFTEKLIGSIIGIEMVITRLAGKWKISQNQPLKNQLGVIQGLNSRQQTEMATLVSSGIDQV
ncbi:FMN-binding negative transcriptional regulator [Methylomonas sp. AM2-LC]|uniref:FMN-binding negative transcriptional regulator n=1 Tax=Methylomonas sp. AM2-LC TaxID=3153301 RepID=UPI003263FA0B